MMRLVRRVLLAMLILVVLVVAALAWVVFTETGTRWTLGQVQQRVDGLSLRVTDGSLWRGVTLADAGWTMPGLAVSADRLELRWRPDCLQARELCVDALRTEGLTVALDPASLGGREPAPPPEPGPSSKLDLPVAITLSELTLAGTRVTVADGPRITVDRLTTAATLAGSELRVSPTAVEGVAVTVPAGGAGDDAAPEAGARPSPASDEPLQLPLSIALEALALRGLDVNLEGGPRVALDRLETGLTLSDGALRVAQTRVTGMDVTVPGGGDDVPDAATPADDAASGNGAPDADDPAPAGPADGGGRLNLPLAIHLAGLRLEDTRVDVGGGPRVALARLETAGALEGDRLALEPTALDGLAIELPAGGDEAAEQGPEPATADDGPLTVELPTIALPLDIAVARLTVTDATLDQGGTARRLDRLVTEAALAGQTLRLDRFEARAPRGSADLSGQVTLGGDWPLDLTLDVTARELMDAGAQTLKGRLEGSLADLSVSLQATGAVAATLKASARVLTPDIPWQAELTSPGLQWPLTGEPRVRLDSVDLSAEGDVDTYRATLETALEGPSIPPGQWRLVTEATPRNARIESLHGELLGGSVDLAGTVGWAPDVQWDVTLSASGLQPGQWREGLDATVSGDVAVTGGVGDGGWRLDAAIRRIDGRWRGQPLSVQGGVGHTVDGMWTVSELVARSGENRVRLDGRIDSGWDLTAELDMPELASLWPGLGGRLNGEVAVSGALAEPSVEGALQGENVAWQDLSIAELDLSLDVAALLAGDSRVRLTADGLRRGDRTLGRASLVLDGDRASHTLTVEAAGLPGDVAAELTVNGGLELQTRRWDGRLADGRLSLPDGEWRLGNPAALNVALAPVSVSLAPHCWRRRPASLCLREAATYSADGARLVAALDGFPLADLDPFLPPTVDADARVDAAVDLDWGPERGAQATASVESTDGSVTLGDPETMEPLVVAYQRVALGLNLDPQQARVELTLATDQFGEARADVRVDPYAAVPTMDGTVQLSGLGLAPLQPFVPALRELEGAISVDGRVNGTLEKPTFNGSVRLAEGMVGLKGAPIPIEDIGVTLDVAGDSAAIDGDFRAGAGTGRVAGTVSWGDGVNASVALVGDGLEFAYPPIVRRLTLSPALALSVTPEEISVNGRLTVPSGRFVLDDLPAGSVSVSEDAVLVNKPAPEPGSEGPSLKTNIYLVLGDDVRFEGLGAQGRLTGSLNLRQIGTGGAEANGEILLKDASYKAYGQNLTIREGRFLFAGPITEPQIEVEAIRRVDDVIAGLRVTGSASQPEVTLFSEPPMAQADILTYLITGSAPGGATPSEQELVAQAALSLGVLGGEAIGSQLAERLGVEDFQLGATGQGEETQVAVSGQIAPNLIVSYGVGVFRPENTLTLRYYLTQQLYLEAVSGFESALDVFYSFDF